MSFESDYDSCFAGMVVVATAGVGVVFLRAIAKWKKSETLVSD